MTRQMNREEQDYITTPKGGRISKETLRQWQMKKIAYYQMLSEDITKKKESK